MAEKLTAHTADTQAHQPISDDFFALFLDPSRTYSCAYFEHDGMTLEQAQMAKIDLALGQLSLTPGMTLLDIGCGWGAAMRRAIENYGVDVVGLTLSKSQADHVEQLLDGTATTHSRRVLQAGWEQFDEPVDRIVSIGAFEYFGRDRYPAFFRMAYDVLPPDGVMVLHTICGIDPRYSDLPPTLELARFMKFISNEIIPGGGLPSAAMVRQHSAAAGFRVTRVQSLQPHYARTVDRWAEALEAHREEAIATASVEVYDRYMRYLTGCAAMFRRRQMDVNQFTLAKLPDR